MTEQTESGVLVPEEALAEPEPEPAAEGEEVSREPSEYVVLVGIDAEDGQLWWREMPERVVGRSRRAAFEIAREKYGLTPTEDGGEAMVHLVPTRSWKRITLRLAVPEPQLSVDGL